MGRGILPAERQEEEQLNSIKAQSNKPVIIELKAGEIGT
jgi:hypothetical protein